MKILFCQLRNHGDIIRIFPLIDAIKKQYPNWIIGFTCFKEMVELCKLNTNIDIIIPQPRLKPVIDTQGETRVLDCSIFTSTIEAARKENFDLYVDLHGVFQSALFGSLSNIKKRLGRSGETTKDGASLFYTDIAPIVDSEINRMERHFKIINHIYPEIKPIIKQRQKSRTVLIFPGSSKMGVLKRWPIEYYIKLSRMITNHKVIFVLGPEELDLYDILVENNIKNIIISNNWQELDKILADTTLVIGNDSAYIHFAVWRNVAAIMICGPLSPVVNGIWKYGQGSTVFNEKRCKCKYLWQGKCDNNHICLDLIDVDSVFEQVKLYI